MDKVGRSDVVSAESYFRRMVYILDFVKSNNNGLSKICNLDSETDYHQMSPKQYYFPYFFNHTDFNKDLKSFGLSSNIIYDYKIQMPLELVIVKHTFFAC